MSVSDLISHPELTTPRISINRQNTIWKWVTKSDHTKHESPCSGTVCHNLQQPVENCQIIRTFQMHQNLYHPNSFQIIQTQYLPIVRISRTPIPEFAKVDEVGNLSRSELLSQTPELDTSSILEMVLSRLGKTGKRTHGVWSRDWTLHVPRLLSFLLSLFPDCVLFPISGNILIKYNTSPLWKAPSYILYLGCQPRMCLS